jgi:hypothetical protein
VERYVPDSVEARQVVNDSPHMHPAVEVSLSGSGPESEETETTWVFANQAAELGSLPVLFRQVKDPEELRQLLDERVPTPLDSRGVIRVDHKGSTVEFPLEKCTDQAVKVGESGYTLRVLRYLPHAVVGSDRQVRSASEQPVNPAVEVEVSGPEGKLKRFAFAKFPEFWSMHGSKTIEGLKVTFVTPTSHVPAVPIDIISGPEGELHVRFSRDGTEVVRRAVSVGVPCDSPWPGRQFTVLRRFDHARLAQSVVPADPIRRNRVPALFLKVSTPEGARTLWLQKYHSHLLTASGEQYELTYRDRVRRFGFNITLDQFRIGYYPGTRRPRSFKSHITILEPTTGRKLSRVISMNHPVSFGGYSLYQSSYREHREGMISYLSVSRDPGQPIVFAGYIALLAGMLLVLGQRMGAQRRRARHSVQPLELKDGA